MTSIQTVDLSTPHGRLVVTWRPGQQVTSVDSVEPAGELPPVEPVIFATLDGRQVTEERAREITNEMWADTMAAVQRVTSAMTELGILDLEEDTPS